jgi:hypothetical protein
VAAATAAAWDGAPTRAEKRQQIRRALLVPETLPAIEAEPYGQVEIAPGVTAERVSYATDYGPHVPAIVPRRWWSADDVVSIPKMGATFFADLQRRAAALHGSDVTEQREGGTRALGTGVPAVDVWQREKEKYVYETWVKAARARVK